jgi:hypothetical protein
VSSAFASAALAGAVQTVPDPDRVSPGFAGFAVMFLLAVATIVLIRSMTKHMRKVRYLPEPPDPSTGAGSVAGKPGQRQRPGDVVHDQRVDSGRE